MQQSSSKIEDFKEPVSLGKKHTVSHPRCEIQWQDLNGITVARPSQKKVEKTTTTTSSNLATQGSMSKLKDDSGSIGNKEAP